MAPHCADNPPGTGLEAAPASERFKSKLICRVRPCDKPCQVVTVLEREARIEVGPEKNQPGEPLRFDHVLHSNDPREQEELFELIQPGVLGCFEGGTCTVVAHGGPQSGKSYTLSGFFTNAQMHGLAPRAIRLIVDVMQTGRSNVVAIESSFFEIQQDDACDLIKGGYPKVGLHELSEAPYLVLDASLSAHKCDGAAGFSRLLDTYFTGLEHRRKGSHTCFQIAFLHGDGRQRSYLRFVEIAWPRPQAATGSSTAVTAGKAVPSCQGAAPSRVAAALEQVFHCKLASGASAESLASAYRSSPLALLLKPSLEGAGVLYFVHCLRLEQMQLPCLALVAPLLAKLHLWLTAVRGTPFCSGSPAASAVCRRRAVPTVPPLRLGGGGDGGAGDCAHAMPRLDDGPSSGSATSTSSLDHSSQPAISSIAASASPLAAGGPDGGAGSSLVQATAVAQPAFEASGRAEQTSGEAVLDSWLLHQCSDLVANRQRSIQTLRTDVERSMAFLRDLHGVLDQLRAQRHAAETGPSEKETNLKILYEKVYRSLQRTAEEFRRMHEDSVMLNQFCGGSIIPGCHDTCSAKEDAVGGSVFDHATGQGGQGAVASEAQPQVAAPFVAAAPDIAGFAKEALVVPQLPLDLLPQEHPTQPAHWPTSMSPSSASSCSSDPGTTGLTGTAATVAPNQNMTRAPATLHAQVPSAVHASCIHVLAPHAATTAATVGTCVGTGLAALPQTPPVPTSLGPQPSSLQAHGGNGPSFLTPYHGFVSLPIPIQWNRPLDDVREVDEGEEEAMRQGSVVPHWHTAMQGCSLMAQASNAPSAGSSVRPMHSEVITADGAMEGHRLQKSHSTASLRSLGPRCTGTAVGQSLAVAGHSPLLGNRTDLAGASPLRGSLSGSASGSCIGASGRGGTSSPPPLPPKRAVPAVPAAAVPARAGVAPQRPCKPRAATPAARPGGAPPPQSYSPMALGRAVSTQALRLERTSPALKVRPHGPCLARSPSPDPARIAVAASPMHNVIGRGPASPPMSTPNLAFRSLCAPSPVCDLQAAASFGAVA